MQLWYRSRVLGLGSRVVWAVLLRCAAVAPAWLAARPAQAAGELIGPQGKSGADAPLDPWRREYTALPVFAFSSDTGLQLGGLVSSAQYSPDAYPYGWRLEALLSASVRHDPQGRWDFPMHNDHLALDLPGLYDDRLRVAVELHYRALDGDSWYGIGNRSSAAVPAGVGAVDAARLYHRFERIFPSLELNTRWRLWQTEAVHERRRLECLVGAAVFYDSIHAPSDSELASDRALADSGTGADAATLRGLLHGTRHHWLPVLRLGVIFDTRDHELIPSHGVFVEAGTRVTPAPADLRHAGFYLDASGFVPLVSSVLTLAVRGFGDLMVGDPPFYALAQSGVMVINDAPGGAMSVRGVLQHRYAGKVKVVGNVELRTGMLRFTVFDQRLGLGLLAFGDAGRVWADTRAVRLSGRSVDGPLWRFATGVGGGVRMAWGEAMVVRADYAHSPSDGTDGFYFDLGQVF